METLLNEPENNLQNPQAKENLGDMTQIESKSKEVYSTHMLINEKTIYEIVVQLFENLKDNSDNLDSLSRKSIIDLSQTNMEIVIKVGVDTIGNLLKNTSTSSILNDWLDSDVDLLLEIYEKNSKSINSTTNKILSTFLVDSVKFYIEAKPSQGKELEKFRALETRTMIIKRLLIKLANACFKDVLTDLLTLFPSGNIPHKFVLDLLTELAETYMLKVVYNYSEVISRMLPILSAIKEEQTRVLFCKLLSVICESVISSIESESILDSETNSFSIVSNTTLKSSLDSLSPLFATAFDLIQSQWLNCLKYTNKASIAKTVILLGALLPETSVPNQIDKILELYTQNIKKECFDESLLLTKALRMYLDLVTAKNKVKLESAVNSLLVAIFPVITSVNMSPNVKEFNPNYAKLRSEVLQILSLLLHNFLDKTFTFLISRFDVPSSIERLSNIYLIKSLLIKTNNIPETYRDMLLSAVAKATHESDFELKVSLIELTHILFEKNLLTNESANKLISFMIKESSYSDESIEKVVDNPSYPFITTIKHIRDKAEYVLIEIVNKVENSEKYFWPALLEFMVDSKYNGSQFIICKLIQSCKVVLDNKGEPFSLGFAEDSSKSSGLSSIPSASQILIKMFIILSDPLKRTGLPFITINIVKTLFPLLHSDLKNSKPDLSEVENYLKKGKYFDENKYLDILSSTWDRILNDIKSTELLGTLTDSMLEFINNHSKETMVVSFIMRLFGLVLSQITKREVIKNQLNNLFSVVHPEFKHDVINGNAVASTPSSVLSTGLAEAFGLTAKNHLDVVLDKVNSIFKCEIQYTKPTGISALFSSSKDPVLSIHIKTTLVLALGRIAKYAKADMLSSRVNSNFLSYIDQFYKDESTPAQLKLACIKSLGCVFKALHKLSSFYIDSGDVFILHSRDSYLENMVSLFKKEKKFNELKVEALYNISNLTQLDPPISLEKCRDFIDIAFSIYENKEVLSQSEMSNRALEASNAILQAVLTHESHLTSNYEPNANSIDDIKNKKSTSGGTPKDSREKPYEFILNYKKEILSSWDFFALVLEQFLSLYVKSTSEMKPVLYDQVESFVNSKKLVRFVNKDEFKCWCVSLVILFFLLFDEDKGIDKEGILLCISRMLTGIKYFNFSMSTNLEDTAVELVNILASSSESNTNNSNNSKGTNESHGFEHLELLFFTQKLFHLLKFYNPSVTKHVSSMLELIFIKRPQDFKLEKEGKDKSIEVILTSIIDILENCESTESSGFKQVLKNAEGFSDINLDMIIDACMDEKYGLPLPVSLACIIQRISKDDRKLKSIFEKITDIINNDDPGFENKPNYKVCASTVILGTILSDQPDPSSKAYEKITKFFPQLLSTLILRIGSSHSINYTIDAFKAKEEDPRNQTVWTMHQLLKYSQFDEIAACLQSGGSIQSKLMETYEYDEGVYELMMICCQRLDHKSQKLMFDFMEEFLDRPWNGQRVVAVCSMAQFVYFASEMHCKVEGFDIAEWRSSLIEKLSSYNIITDADDMVRKMAIRGLANLTKVYLESVADIDVYIKSTLNKKPEEINDEMREEAKLSLKASMFDKAYDSTLNYIIEKISDTSENVVVESLKSLQHMVEYLSIKSLTPYMPNLLKSLRPCFDNGNPNVRALGFNLFSNVIGLLIGESTNNEQNLIKTIKDQVHNHLVSLLLHSNDEVLSVRKNSLKCLHKALSAICNANSEEAYEGLKSKCSDDQVMFDEFMTWTTELIHKQFPDKVPYHIQNLINHSLSTQESIRGSSVVPIGLFYSLLVKSNNEEVLKHVNVDQIFNNFTKLLKDFSSRVKVRTVKALKLFRMSKANN